MVANWRMPIVVLALLAGCGAPVGGGTVPEVDAVEPTVAIEVPPDGSVLNGTVVVTGTAADNVAVTRVELQIDAGGWLVAAGTTVWSLVVDTDSLTNGTHTLRARAFDAAGNSGTATRPVTVSKTVAAADFPGHQPGKIYLGYGVDGASCPQGSTEAEEMTYTGPIGVGRYYRGDINSTTSEVNFFEAELAANRFPWVSFKENPYTWAQIAAGDADALLRAKAQAYRGVSGPGFITFHHEPNGDGAPADYVAAWHRILDVWEGSGGTGEITPVPVLNGFFQGYPHAGSGYTDAEMAEWMPDALLRRFRVIGYDAYDSGIYGGERIPAARTVRKWREWLLRRQAVINDGKQRYLALGEVGVFYGTTKTTITTWPTSTEGEFPEGYPGWAQLWAKVTGYGSGDASYVVINYYNSIFNTDSGLDWTLRARRPTTSAEDLACDSGNPQPPPGPGVADPTRVTHFKNSLESPQAAWVKDL